MARIAAEKLVEDRLRSGYVVKGPGVAPLREPLPLGRTD